MSVDEMVSVIKVFIVEMVPELDKEGIMLTWLPPKPGIAIAFDLDVAIAGTPMKYCVRTQVKTEIAEQLKGAHQARQYIEETMKTELAHLRRGVEREREKARPVD